MCMLVSAWAHVCAHCCEGGTAAGAPHISRGAPSSGAAAEARWGLWSVTQSPAPWIKLMLHIPSLRLSCAPGGRTTFEQRDLVPARGWCLFNMCFECSEWLSPFTGSRREGVRGEEEGEEGGAVGAARARQAALLAMMGAKMEASWEEWGNWRRRKGATLILVMAEKSSWWINQVQVWKVSQFNCLCAHLLSKEKKRSSRRMVGALCIQQQQDHFFLLSEVTDEVTHPYINQPSIYPSICLWIHPSSIHPPIN